MSYRKIIDDLYYVGCDDKNATFFENHYPLVNGMSYNSYLILDDVTILFETIDQSVSDEFFFNLKALLKARPLDYLIVSHVEPDHAKNISEVIKLYPNVKVIGNKKTFTMLHQFNDFTINEYLVTDGTTLKTKNHELVFLTAPMVHWPEVMFTYDKSNDILFSADAFGSFITLDGNIFSSEVILGESYLSETRRYYSNVVGKYGKQVNSILDKLEAKAYKIAKICPLHGYILDNHQDVCYLVSLYRKWASYEAEDNSVVIIYGSIYGNTKRACDFLATTLADLGVKNIKLYDANRTDVSYLLSEVFRAKNIVIASVTYNNEIFTNINTFIEELQNHNIQNRNIALMENGSWAPVSAKKMQEKLVKLKNINILDNVISIKSSVKKTDLESIASLAKEIFAFYE